MSKITVTTIAGQTSGGDANTVKIESGDSLNVVSGDLTVDTTTLKVDSSNNRVGVGTASPTSDLHVSGGAGAHVAIQSSAGSHWRLGDAVGSSNGIFVVRDHTNSANRIQILADGKTQIAQGVTFGSDTAAANTLDDYEEGTWTPVCYGSTTAGTFSNGGGTYGKYIKVGQIVYLNCVIQGTITGHGGYARISGLPFATDSDLGYTAAAQWNNMPFQSLGETDHHIVAIFNTNYIHFRGNDRRINEAYGGVDWGGGSPQSITYLRIGGCYKTT